MTEEERIATVSRYLGITPEQAANLPRRVIDVAAGEDECPPPAWLNDILKGTTPGDRGEVVKFWRLLRVIGPAMKEGR